MKVFTLNKRIVSADKGKILYRIADNKEVGVIYMLKKGETIADLGEKDKL